MELVMEIMMALALMWGLNLDSYDDDDDGNDNADECIGLDYAA